MRPQTSESRISAAIAVAPALQKSTSWIPGPGLKAYPAASGPWPAIYPNVKIFRSPSRCKNTPQACCPACCAACHTSPHLAQRFEAPDILDLVQVTQVRREVSGRARQQPDAGRSHHRRRPAGAGTHARARARASALAAGRLALGPSTHESPTAPQSSAAVAPVSRATQCPGQEAISADLGV